MSRRSVPDSPWQNGMPPFGFCPQPFNLMMNYGPMWAGQSNLPFMGGNMPPDMMRFGGNVPPRSYFRRSFDQPPDRYSTRQGFNDRYGNRQGYGRGGRKRPGPSDRSRSPAPKRATQRRDGARRAEEETREGASEGETAATEEEATEDGAAQADDLYDPAEPTTEDTVEGAEVAEGQEDDSGDVNQEAGNEDGDQEPGSSTDKDEMGGGEAGPSTSTAKSGSKPLAKPATKAPVPKTSETKAPSKPADGKGQAGGRPSDKGRQEQGPRRSGQKDKGWCTVCEIHFDGSFLDHRRTEDHKVKRDEKYPKCHACSMGFNNPKQYEHHCAGDLHRKNVEVLDNEVDETAGPLGEEYLEEVPAYYCTLCKLLLKVDLKTHHCCTQGHYRRHRDLKRKEEATKKAKLAKEKAEEEEDDTNQETYTITDEVGSDDEARAASDAAGEGTSESKRDVADEAQQEVSVEQPEGDHDVEEPEASEDKVDPLEGEGDNEQHAQQEEEEREDASELEAASAAASLLDEPKESDAADRNGCKGPEEDVAEENPAVVAPATTAARAAATSAATAGAPKATVSKLPPPKVVVKKVPAAKATVAVTKPSATAAKVPPPKAGTAANSAASTTGRAPSGAATAKTPVAPAASAAAAAAPGRGGMVRGRGRGLPPKAVRARKR